MHYTNSLHPILLRLIFYLAAKPWAAATPTQQLPQLLAQQNSSIVNTDLAVNMLGGSSCSKPSSSDDPDSDTDDDTPSDCLNWPIDSTHHLEFHHFNPLSKHRSAHALPNYLTAIAAIQADLWTDPSARPDAIMSCKDANPDPGHSDRNWWYFGTQVHLLMFFEDDPEGTCRLTYLEAAKMFASLADFVRQHGVGELKWKLVREGPGEKEGRVATVGLIRWWHHFEGVQGAGGMGNGTVDVA